jgi:formylglycine-generating enzyme required for sulfatase activity
MIHATSFYIDATEVSHQEYAAFQAAKAGDHSGQATECSWNASYDPEYLQGSLTLAAGQPQTDVDFCDAAAFCAWADKRLCGKISGGSLALSELNDSSFSQWFVACAGPKGDNAYPYGHAYHAGWCNDQSGSQHLEPVGSFPSCAGYYPGLADMLGNAQEWTDTCDGKTGPSDGCERIGGSYLKTTSCGESGLARRDFHAPELGFRCCSK